MLVKQLIDAISSEQLRIWGKDGFTGTPDQYIWLQRTFGVTEEDLALWSAVLLHEFNSSDDHDCSEQMRAFLSDRNMIAQFLYGLLRKYRSSDEGYRADGGV